MRDGLKYGIETNCLKTLDDGIRKERGEYLLMTIAFNTEIKRDKSSKASWAVITGTVNYRLPREKTQQYRGPIVHYSNVKIVVSIKGYKYNVDERCENTSAFSGCRISMNGSTFLSFEDLESLYERIQHAKSILMHLQGESSL